MNYRSMPLVAVVAALVAAPSIPAAESELPQAVVKSREMVVTANPLATEAGEKILKRGGSAADAMVAVQTVLGLVEPQSSGLGGGAFVVYYDAATDTLTTIDAREKAPAAANENRFDGLGFSAAWQSGLSVGVPGTPRMLEYMHQRYGRLPWKPLFNPAKQLAQKGFELTERTSSQVQGLLDRNASCAERLYFRDPVALAYFADPATCEAKPAGTKIKNKDYADTLKAIANKGADGFYTGEIAQDIADAVQGDLALAGDMTTQDLKNYEVVERPPVCIEYRSRNVCGMGPPSSGALAVGQILGILENFDLSAYDGPLDEEMVHLFTQAGRLAFADRGLYVGDTDFVTVPVEGMLNKAYLESRANLITNKDTRAEPGTPPGEFDPTAPDNTAKNSGTSHVSIVDRYGNALSMTTTIESSFGNGVMVHGFLLNNELTDFSFNPTGSDGVPVANRVQPNKRPRSSMSPTIVFDAQDNVELVTGSPGGSRIIGYTAQSIVNVFDFGFDPQEAINVPHYQNRNGSTDIEKPIPGVTNDYDAEGLEQELEEACPASSPCGHSVNVRDLTSGLSLILVTEDGLVGGADQRRDGTVGGSDYPGKSRR